MTENAKELMDQQIEKNMNLLLHWDDTCNLTRDEVLNETLKLVDKVHTYEEFKEDSTNKLVEAGYLRFSDKVKWTIEGVKILMQLGFKITDYKMYFKAEHEIMKFEETGRFFSTPGKQFRLPNFLNKRS